MNRTTKIGIIATALLGLTVAAIAQQPVAPPAPVLANPVPEPVPVVPAPGCTATVVPRTIPPCNVEASNLYVERAAMYAAKGPYWYADVIFSYDSAINYNPNNVAALMGRAKLRESLGHFPNAYNDYARVRALEPGNTEALNDMRRLFVNVQ